MNIGLIAPPTRKAALALAEEAARHLTEQGVTVYGEPEAGLPCCANIHDAASLDALVCVGGDGTLLHTVRWAVHFSAPVLGINMGRLGFLAETAPARMRESLQALLRGDFHVEERPLLEVRIAAQPENVCLALNDLVLIRAGYPRLVSAVVTADGEKIEQLRADGLIIATPTGSTGYALSAGGPIIAPGVDCMLMDAVCAHSLTHRATILRGSAQVRIHLTGDSLMRVVLQTDGQTQAELTDGDTVLVCRSEKRLQLIHVDNYRFFDTVRAKLTGHSQPWEDR